MDREKIIRYADLTADQRDRIQIYSGGGIRLAPEWLAISKTENQFVLYFLSRAGEIVETVQRDTLREALDEAHFVAGVEQRAWRNADICVPNGPLIRSLFG